MCAKGIVDADDAQQSVEAGAQGMVVSNHGGRQLAGGPPTLLALQQVVARVGDRAEGLLDGDMRSAHDVIVALAWVNVPT